MVRVPKVIVLGFVLIWEIKSEGTLDECTEYCAKNYNIACWKLPWIYNSLNFGNS